MIPIRRSTALQNVGRVFGETISVRDQRRLVRNCFKNQAMAAIELLRAPYFSEKLSIELVEREGFEHLEAVLARGKGMIGVMAHMANVDMIAFSQAIRGLPLHGVVRDIHSKSAQEFVNTVRQRTGMKLIPPRRSADQIRAVLAKNEIIGLVVDQHMPPHRAIVCEFFGMLASTSPAPVRFAFETGATILPVALFRHGNSGKFTMRIEPALELETPHAELQANIRHNTERLNRIIEGWIREAPEQWLWLHRRWKVQNDPTGWDIPEALAHLIEDGRERPSL